MKFNNYLIEKNNNKTIIDDLNKSILLLNKSIDSLHKDAEFYYNNNDNFRGNIRNDAAVRLKGDLDRLIIGKDYINKALKK